MKKRQIINFGLKLGIKQNDILKVLEKITGLDANQLFLNDEIDDKFLEEIEEKFSRLVSGEPIEYIIEKAEFYGLEFYVDSRVLVPRNDTEVMVEKVVNSEKGIVKSNVILIDIGTGSGCIPISILKNLSTDGFNHLKKCYAIDISKDALEVAKINVKKHNLEDKIELIQSDLLENNPLTPLSGGIESLSSPEKENGGVSIIITANLPYIKNGDFENMDEETINFEPDLALYGGEKTGFELYEKLIFQIFDFIKNIPLLTKEGVGVVNDVVNVLLFIEIGFDQKQIAINFLKKQNLKFEIFKDNGGIDRCIKIYF